MALLNNERYAKISERLRVEGFHPDRNEKGNETFQRWESPGATPITVDFLIPPSSESDVAGNLKHLQRDFAAIVAPGLHLAFQDRLKRTVQGVTLKGERASREVWICGPGAFCIMKALAFRGRGETKDAFDLYYVLRWYGSDPRAVARHVVPLKDDPDVERALSILREDFWEDNRVGPRRVAAFLGREGTDIEIQTDVVGLVRSFVEACENPVR